MCWKYVLKTKRFVHQLTLPSGFTGCGFFTLGKSYLLAVRSYIFFSIYCIVSRLIRLLKNSLVFLYIDVRYHINL